MRWLVYFIVRLYLRIFNSLEVRGIEKIPIEGPLIIASNHLSNIDPPAIVSIVSTRRRIHVMAKKELFRVKLIGWILKKFYAIPVDRYAQGGDISSMKEAIKILKDNGCLLIFPEGTRARGRKIAPKKGIAYLAHKTGAKILPVRIFNSENFSKLDKIIITFGEVIEGQFEKGKEDYLNFSFRIMENILSLKI